MTRSHLSLTALGVALFASACGTFGAPSDASPFRWDYSIRYGIFLSDWYGDFMNRPMTGIREEPLQAQLAPLIFDFDPNCCVDDIRLFRIADATQIAGGLRPGNVSVTGQVVATPPGLGLGWGFVADEPLTDGWYVAAYDARPYARFARMELAQWSRATELVAYARFRVGDEVDWVTTYASVQTASGEMAVSIGFSSPVSSARLATTSLSVSRAGVPVDCVPVATTSEPRGSLAVHCPDLRNGDAVTVSVVSDVIGHPTGRMVPHEFVIDAAVPIVDVAPELGLDLVRAAFGLTGTET